MSRSFSRRLAAIEALLAPKPTSWPCIVEVTHDETIPAAIERHIAKHGQKPKLMQGGLLVVPALPRNEEEDRAAQERTEVRQAALMEFVRRRPQPAETLQ